MEENVTLLAAFGAGLLSFISPCVLPLIPGYLSYISGLSLDEMRGTACGRRRRGGRRAARRAAARDPLLAGLHPRLLARLHVARRLGKRDRPVHDGAARRARQDRRRHHHHLRPAHDGRVAHRVAVPGKAGPDAASARPDFSARCWSASRSRSGGRRASARSSPASWRSPRRRNGGQRRAAAGRRIRSASACRSSPPRWPSTASSRRSRRSAATTTRSSSSSGALLVVIGVLIFTNQFTVIAQWLTPYLPVY